MAKRSESGVNKSQAIRDALQANPDMGPKEIAEMLIGQGVAVNAQYVSVIKGQSKKRGRKRKVMVRTREPGRVGRPPKVSPLSAAIEFVRAVGGFDAAKQALAEIEAIKKLS